MASIEEKVEEYFKAVLDDLGIRHFGKTEEINSSITRALKRADSKSGGSGANYPDIQLLLQNTTRRDIPVMIEAKGAKGKLEKLTPGGDIELVSGGKNPNRAAQQFAVNGALHYGLAILDEGTYSEVIVVGINGTMLEEGRVKDPEAKAYYVSKKNGKVPKEIVGFEFVQMKQSNIDTFFAVLDKLSLTAAERERFKKFTLGALFTSFTGDVDLQQKDINGKGQFFINSGVENCGIKGKTDKPAKVFPANTITVDFWGNAYYRDFNYKLATHNHVFSLSGDVIKNRLVGLYIVGMLSKLPGLFSYDNMATWNKLKSLEIKLPVTSAGNIDFDYMERYIRALEKLTIADAVKYKDKVIVTTKRALGV